MSIKIHHGPPGSYKTAGAVTDDLIPAIMSGRPIVTNIRGICLESIYEALPDAPDDIELIHVNTQSRAERQRFATWFHWAPLGAIIFVDEAQSIFPKRWKEPYLESLALDEETAIREGRPTNWWDAWDMHRHYNWDLVLTTPDIDKIRDDIRDASELAYKHKDLGALGKLLFKGKYVEGIHSKDNSGTSPGHFQVVRNRRINKDAPTWKLYESTATGEHRQTIAGFNILSNPRLALSLGVLVLALGYISTIGLPSVGSGLTANASEKTQPGTPLAVQSPAAAPVPVPNGGTNVQPPYEVAAAIKHPLQNATVTYSGFIKLGDRVQHLFDVFNGHTRVYDHLELADMGYTVIQSSYCSFSLYYESTRIHAACRYS